MKEPRSSMSGEERREREAKPQNSVSQVATGDMSVQLVACPLQAQSPTICWAHSSWWQLVNRIWQRPGKKLEESGSEGRDGKGQSRLACFPPKPLVLTR